MPEPVPSLPVRVSVGEAYHPLWIPGVRVAVVTGSFWSTLTVIKCVASWFPALSVDAYTMVCEPSAEIVNGAEYVCGAPPSIVYVVAATPDVASEALSVTWTGTRYQS